MRQVGVQAPGDRRAERQPNREEMRKYIYSVSISDRETKKTIKRIYDQYKVLLEPHGAVGWRGLEVYLELFGDAPLCISLETAHPAKFPDEVRALTGAEPPLPPALAGLDDLRERFSLIPTDYAAFKAHLIREYRA